MTNEQDSQLRAFDRDASLVDPPVHTEPGYHSKGCMHCDCGRSFSAAQFNSWYAHLDTCPTRRTES